MMDLNQRKQLILQAIVEDYIRSNTPVGSRTISKKSGLGVSSATIRNEMADLEEMGYLIQPHVSAGRIPSDRAYRLYVDQLLREGMREEERESARSYFTSRVHDMEDVLSLCAQTLSELTRYTALVLTPRQSDLKVAALHLIPVGEATALLIIVTDTGMVRETTLRVSERLNADSLLAISRMLTEKLRDLSLRQVQDMLYGYAAHGGADARVLSGIAEIAGQIEKQTDTDRITIGGAHNILHYPEYADVARARAFMDTLERKESLLNLLRPQESVAVRIGYETGMKELHDCSVVTAPYRMGRGHIGAIGIIGPTRMDYARVMDTLDVVSRELSAILSL